MKRLLLIAFLLCAGSAFAVGGAGTCANFAAGSCPVYIPSGVTMFYFVSASGNDLPNTGTTEADPLAHAPGMPNCVNNCASITPSPGMGFIFRGGDTWHFGNSAASPYTGGSWAWTHSGSVGSPYYIGVDTGWYAGGSFSRPILNGDNPLWAGGSHFPAACAHDNSSMASLINLGGQNYVQVDNFELTGACWTVNNSSTRGYVIFNGQSKVSNNYCHGWTMTSGADDNFPCFQTAGSTNQTEFAFNVVDGSDSPHFASGTVISGTSSSPACQWSANGNASITNVSENSSNVVTMVVGQNWNPYTGGAVIAFNGLTTATWLNGLTNVLLSTASNANPSTITFTDPTAHGTQASNAEVGVAGLSACASGQAINGAATVNVHDNVFRYVSNVAVSGGLCNFSNNLVEYVYATFASGSNQQHPNVMNDLGACVTGGPLTVSGNIMRHTFMTENVYLAISTTNAYIFNNVFYDNMNSVFGSLPSACFRYNNAPGFSSGVSAYFYNNTMGDATCQISYAPSNAPLLAFNGTALYENDHFIGTSSLSQNWNNGGGTAVTTDNGGEVYMTTGTATTENYLPANNYSPGNGGGVYATVGAGNNLTSSCGTGFTSDLCSRTKGCSEASGSGGQIASCPAIPLIVRPSSAAWDAGAYELTGITQASSPTCVPSSGVAPQSVVCNNPNLGVTVQCYAINSAPATNGAGTSCTAGTLLASGGIVAISAAETLEIIAGTSTSTDSNVSSYVYSAPSVGGNVLNGVFTLNGTFVIY